MKIAVYCGSSEGVNPIYKKEAIRLGEYFSKNSIELVYGGGGIGLMGSIADAVVKNGGYVYGVIPEQLKSKEIAHFGLSELHVVKDMHIRKNMMIKRADAFVAMPGGAGTLDEIFEAWTWLQIGYHQKPCAFYNINGFYDKLLDFISHIVKEGFLAKKYLEYLIVEDNPKKLIEAIKNSKNPMSKWEEPR